MALVLLLTPLATPYAHAYDLVAAAVGLAILAGSAQQRGALPRFEFYALGAAWIWPGVAFQLGASGCPGIGPLFLVPAVVYAASRVRGGAEPLATEAARPR